MKPENKEGLNIILLGRNSLEFFSPSLANIFTFQFPESTVKDLELLNKPGLELQLKTFKNQYKIPPGDLAIILSDSICFEKDIPITEDSKQNEVIQSFLDLVPFEYISHRVFKLQKGKRLIAANKILYKTINDIFISLGFHSIGVTPSSMLGITIKNLDAASARYISEKSHLVRQLTMITPEPQILTTETSEKKVFGVRRIIMFVLIFTVLIAVLILLLINQSKENARIRVLQQQKKMQISPTVVLQRETIR